MSDHTPLTASPIRLATRVVAVVFLLIGVLGFIPGITTNYDELTFAGHHSGAELFGIFGVSVLHNLVHLAFGVLGLVLSTSFNGAKLFLFTAGLAYLALAAYGVTIDRHADANFIPVDKADNLLHLVLGTAMITLGMMFGGAPATHRAVVN